MVRCFDILVKPLRTSVCAHCTCETVPVISPNVIPRIQCLLTTYLLITARAANCLHKCIALFVPVFPPKGYDRCNHFLKICPTICLGTETQAVGDGKQVGRYRRGSIYGSNPRQFNSDGYLSADGAGWVSRSAHPTVLHQYST